MFVAWIKASQHTAVYLSAVGNVWQVQIIITINSFSKTGTTPLWSS